MAVIRILESAPERVAVGFARVIRDASDERIEQVMRTPARRVVLEGIFRQMPPRFDRKRAGDLDATIRWCVTGRPDGGVDAYELRIAGGRCRVTHGANGASPRLTITLDGTEFVKLVTGNSDPTQGYFNRRIQLAGDIMLAAKLQTLFRIPARRG